MKTSIPRISKITDKATGRTISILPTRDPCRLEKSLREAIKSIGNNSDSVGWFIVRRDGSVKTGYSYHAGSSDCHLLGGAELLGHDIKNGENI